MFIVKFLPLVEEFFATIFFVSIFTIFSSSWTLVEIVPDSLCYISSK